MIMYFSKMFFSGNGIKDGHTMTSSLRNAYTQKLGLRLFKRKSSIDSSKLARRISPFVFIGDKHSNHDQTSEAVQGELKFIQK